MFSSVLTPALAGKRKQTKTLLHRDFATSVLALRDTRTLRVWCPQAVASVCHQGREDSSGSADRSINRAELVERCPLTMRHLVKRIQRRLQESRSRRRATSNSRERIGLADQVTQRAPHESKAKRPPGKTGLASYC